MSIEKSMLLISSFREGAPTFRMIPITLNCPYGEVIFIPQARTIAIFHKHSVEGLHMVPKLDENGDMIRHPKGTKEKPYKEERKSLNVPHEAYITDRAEIEQFVEMFAINGTTFDYKKYIVDPKAPQETKAIIEAPETPKLILP